MIRYANPLYDTVFKYLIEDLEIARSFLSILLGLEVSHLEVHSQEVSVKAKLKSKKDATEDVVNNDKNPKSLLRYDFKASIQYPDGSKKVMLLELQKSKLKSIVFRFRNYIGRNYTVDTKSSPLEQIYIYLTGFAIDDAQKVPPYLWCRRKLVDGTTGDLFYPQKDINFVNQMTHESCFIHVNGFSEDDPHPVAQVMNLFNQKRKVDSDYFLEIVEPQVGTLMSKIVNRLAKASLDEEVLMAMELESYYEYDMKGLEEDLEGAELRAEKANKGLLASLMKFQELGLSIPEMSKITGYSEDAIAEMLK